jgi:hypothetical protein
MFNKSGIVLSTAIALGTVLATLAATQSRAVAANSTGATNSIPGYDKDGRTVPIPNPDRS